MSISFDSGDPTLVYAVNHPTSGGTSLSIYGLDFGKKMYSGQNRIGLSGSQATSWTSSTSINSRCSQGVGSGLRVSVTIGLSIGTEVSAITYNLPVVVSGSSQSRSVTGSWCASVGGTCLCQGIVSFVGSDGSLSSSVSDSSISVTCSGASTEMCYCFNRPFTGGQSVTVIGSNFGVDDQTPSAIISSSSAELTHWLSQSSLICTLPTCTDCVLSSTSQSLVVDVAGLVSTSQFISVPYSYVNASSRRLLGDTVPNDGIFTPYVFHVPDKFKCPYFSEREGVFFLKSTSGMLCRREYSQNEALTWILDPCSSSENLCNSSNIQSERETVTLLQISLFFTFFEVGHGDSISVSSCATNLCTSHWTRIAEHSGVQLPPSVTGSPFLMIRWSSDNVNDRSTGWSAFWNVSYGRKFKIFHSLLTRQEAAATCSSISSEQGAWSLASLSTSQEQSSVAALAALSDIWIGFADLDQEGVYGWPDGSRYEPSEYTNWGVGEPDNSGVDDFNNADCTVLGGAVGGLWRTESCFSKFKFVCSKL